MARVVQYDALWLICDAKYTPDGSDTRRITSFFEGKIIKNHQNRL